MISKSVMKTGEFDDNIFYRIACDCTDKDCDLVLELEKDKRFDMIFLNLYKKLAWCSSWHNNNTWYKNLWCRIKCSLKMLFTGYISVEESFIMREEQIDGFIEAINEAKNKLSTK